MYCNKCGKELMGNEEVCPSCGNRIIHNDNLNNNVNLNNQNIEQLNISQIEPNNQVPNENGINQMQYNIGTNIPNINTNTKIESNIYKSISSKGKILMILVIIGSLIIIFDDFILYKLLTNLYIFSTINKIINLKYLTTNFEKIIEIKNWLIILIFTITSFILDNKERKIGKQTKLYDFYISIGILYLFGISTIAILYVPITFLFAFKNKKVNKLNNHLTKKDKFLLVFSIIAMILIVFFIVGSRIRIKNFR